MSHSDDARRGSVRANSALFHVHAVGSRGFGSSFDISQVFSDSVVFHNYEPDDSANAQTRNYFADSKFMEFIYPVAVYGQDGKVVLNLNYDPYTSSIFESNPKYKDFYFPYKPPAGDYVFGEAATAYRRLEVPAVRLDQAHADAGTAVDWIAMDTQGSEYDILIGAEGCCATTLVGFSAEVEFHPLYQGQKLFGDIAAFAVRHGFHLARLTPHPAGSFRRAPLGWRGEGLTVAADAVFLKTPEAIKATHPVPGLGLRKLAFASVCHGNMEHALDALLAAAQLPPWTGNAPTWIGFLDRLLEIYRGASPLFPVTFKDIYSLDDSLARFAPECRDQNEDPARTARRFFAHTDPAQFAASLPALLSTRPTPLESLLTEHGLDQVAQLVRRNRQTSAFDCCRAVDWFRVPCGPLAEAGRRVGTRLSAAGPVGFYGTGEMFAIADALLCLPDAAIGSIFDGSPARQGVSIRGQTVRSPATAADPPSCACIVLNTQGSEAAMCRSLMNSGFQGRVIGFDELLALICDDALDHCGGGG